MKRFLAIVRILLGAVFLYAAYDKILHPEAFSAIVQNYRILPPQFANLAAIFLPWLEAVCGLALILGFLTRGAALLTMLLMLVFMGALSYNLFRGLDVQCGCFGVSPASGGDVKMDLVRDAAILLLAVFTLAAQRAKKERRGLL